MYTCFAIDDDFSSLEIIKDYIDLQQDFSLLGVFNNAKIALRSILKGPTVDIIFMDIEMPEMSGIELSNLIRHKAKKIIFITGYNNYAEESYQLGIADYLLKPVSLVRFENAIQKTINEKQLDKPQNIPSEKEWLYIKHAKENKKISKLRLNEIIAIEGSGNYVKIHSKYDTILAYKKLSDFSQIKGFVQIHRSFIISEDFIKHISGNHVILHNGSRMPIGINFKNSFKMKY